MERNPNPNFQNISPSSELGLEIRKLVRGIEKTYPGIVKSRKRIKPKFVVADFAELEKNMLATFPQMVN